MAVSAKYLKIQLDVAESVYDGIVALFTEYGYNSEDWKSKVLEHEVGRSDKSLVQRTFDFSMLRGLK